MFRVLWKPQVMDQIQNADTLIEEAFQVCKLRFESLVTSIEAGPKPRGEKGLDLRSVVIFRKEDLVARVK
jgi:hypothetical protein